jgi:hypothetical protein
MSIKMLFSFLHTEDTNNAFLCHVYKKNYNYKPNPQITPPIGQNTRGSLQPTAKEKKRCFFLWGWGGGNKKRSYTHKLVSYDSRYEFYDTIQRLIDTNLTIRYNSETNKYKSALFVYEKGTCTNP